MNITLVKADHLGKLENLINFFYLTLLFFLVTEF